MTKVIKEMNTEKKGNVLALNIIRDTTLNNYSSYKYKKLHKWDKSRKLLLPEQETLLKEYSNFIHSEDEHDCSFFYLEDLLYLLVKRVVPTDKEELIYSTDYGYFLNLSGAEDENREKLKALIMKVYSSKEKALTLATFDEDNVIVNRVRFIQANIFKIINLDENSITLKLGEIFRDVACHWLKEAE